jgi:SAM-dependent MidA family methyltransferase
VTLRQLIEQEIRAHGPLPFSRYLEMCLYEPELGYYARHAEQFGKAGDFYTSSDIHAVFGRLMARQLEEMWRVFGSPERIDLLELGPGRGLFARDVMDWSEQRFPDFFAALRYVLVESSPALRNRLARTLETHVAAGKAVIKATLLDEDLPSPLPDPVIVFANELFDALPVEVVSSKGEMRIGCQNGQLRESFVPASPEVQEYLDRYGIHPEPGERVETGLVAQNLMAQIASKIDRGFVMVVDYGYTREEQLAGRHRGTITAIRNHTVSPTPYDAPGEQDITAHVNFTAITAAGEQSGLERLGLVTQAQFLMGVGEENQFADAFSETRQPQERTKVALQLKHLITPAGMGESFHVLVMSKGVDFSKAKQLSGLKFAR